MSASPIAPPLLLALASACGGTEPTAGVSARSAGDLTGHVLVADSPGSLVAWTRAAPSAREGLPGLPDQVVYGQRVFVRAAVSGTPARLAEPGEVAGLLTLRAPDGTAVHEERVTAGAADLDPEAPGVLVLRPGLDLVFDPGDPTGTYRIEAALESGGQPFGAVHSFIVADGGLALPPAP